MKFITGIIFFFSASFIVLFAQSNNVIDKLQAHYEQFEYSDVINEAEKILMDKQRLNDTLIIEIFTIKAASHFAMGDQNNTRRTFIEILKLNDEYQINELIYSPKLIAFYNEVETEFHEIIKLSEMKFESQEDIYKNNLALNEDEKKLVFNNALAKSLLLPGLGHFDFEANTKGWILTSASIVSLSSTVYFIIDANSKERDYLGETNSDLIQKKYDSYNNSYKLRNILITSYIAIWLYTQIDILFFSNELGSKYISNSLSNYNQTLPNDRLLISFKFDF